MEEKISVIIPTYKRSEKLCRAIESVLQQTYQNIEVIVVDDNDSDSEYRKINADKMKKYSSNSRVIYLKHEKNKNGAAARNTGIKEATGEYITFLDDDDEFYENRMYEIEKTIKEYGCPDFICTGVQFRRNGKILKERIPNLNKEKEKLILELIKQESFIGTGSNIVCKKEIVDKINGFDERFLRHQDLEFLIRFLNNCSSYYCVEKVLVIKNNDDTLNVPNFEKFYNTKIMFLEKFENIINNYEKSTIKEINIKNYYEILDTAYFLNNKEYIKKSKKLLKDKNIYNLFYICKYYLKNKIKKMKIISLIRDFIARKKARWNE